MTKYDQEICKRVGERLGLTADGVELASEYDTTIARLEESTDVLVDSPAAADHIGVAATDEYNAILDRYPDPRTDGNGPLSTLSIVVKDNIAVAGLEMTCGSDSFSVISPTDAVVIERLLDAGVRIIGKDQRGTGNHRIRFTVQYGDSFDERKNTSP